MNIPAAELDGDYPEVPGQWFEQQGFLRAAWELREDRLLLTAESAEGFVCLAS